MKQIWNIPIHIILKKDFSASIVVFLVALPLCLGIAHASGAPLYAGIFSGIVGGIIVGAFSGSHLSVSGPAAGLTIIVYRSIQDLNSYSSFLVAVALAGIIQIFMGFVKAGTIKSFFPNSVIQGMLAAIGIILIINQIPVSIGLKDWKEASLFMSEAEIHVPSSLFSFKPSLLSLFIVISSLWILWLWETPKFKNYKLTEIISAPLVIVIYGSVFHFILSAYFPEWSLHDSLMVQIPKSWELLEHIYFPDWSTLGNSKVYTIAITIALVASLETLLSIEAIDKLDPKHRETPPNRELIAQGTGNFICGMVGAIPLTSVIVRSSANLTSGAVSKFSSIFHGLWLLLAVLFFSEYLNYIPLASLSVILFQVGYKLSKPSILKEFYSKGHKQFVPFIITIIAIVITDLLIGVIAGIFFAIIYVLIENYRESTLLTSSGNNYTLILKKDIFFLNKHEILTKLKSIPPNSTLEIQNENISFIDYDIIEILKDFIDSCKTKNIQVEYKSIQKYLDDL